MSKIYSYAELKGKIKVGDKVSAVDGWCEELGDGRIGTITEVSPTNFSINGCSHCFNVDARLTLHPRIKTWDTLEVGDEVRDDAHVRKVLEIGAARNALLFSCTDDLKTTGNWYSFEEVKRNGWSIVQPEEEKEEPVMFTKEQAEAIKKAFPTAGNPLLILGLHCWVDAHTK